MTEKIIRGPKILSEETMNLIRKGIENTPQKLAMTLNDIYKEFTNRKILINKENYLKNGLLTDAEASTFVEDIFLGLGHCVSETHFLQYENGIKEIIYGQNFCLSLVNFMRGEYRLRSLKQKDFLNGLYFHELSESLQEKLRNYIVSVQIVQDIPEDKDYKNMLLERLNS